MSSRLQVLCFLVGGRTFAADIRGIREILRNQRFTPVPHTPPHVAGVLNLRGELIPVVDLHSVLMGATTVGATEERKLVVVVSRGRTAALLVDQVLDVVTVRPEELTQVPGGYGQGKQGESAVVLATFRRVEGTDDGVVVLVRLAPVVEAAAAQESEEVCQS